MSLEKHIYPCIWGSRNLCAFLSAAKSIPHLCSCGIRVAIYETACCRHNVPDYYRMTSGFYVSSEMVIQIFNFFIWDKNFKCFRWNKRNVLVTTLVGFVELFIFLHFVSTFPCENWEKRALFSWLHVRKKNWSLIFSDNRKMPTHGSTTPLGNSASLVSDWTIGPLGWDFLVSTEHQWWILFT